MTAKQLQDLQFLGELNRLRYLEGTVWYVIRKVELDTDIPPEILNRRQAARDEIDELRTATDYEQIKDLTKDFS